MLHLRICDIRLTNRAQPSAAGSLPVIRYISSLFRALTVISQPIAIIMSFFLHFGYKIDTIFLGIINLGYFCAGSEVGLEGKI